MSTIDRYTAARIARTYEERGDSAAADDIRAGNTPPTGEMADDGMVLQYVGLDDGGAETTELMRGHACFVTHRARDAAVHPLQLEAIRCN
jgi:hypothetical protein